MRYAASAPYTLQLPVSEFIGGSYQDPTSHTLLAGFGLADAGVDGVQFSSADWATDSSTNPPAYFAAVDIGPTSANVLTAGRWMSYLSINGEIFETGLIEVY